MLPPRIEKKIERHDDGCWHWTACLNSQGRGQIWWQGRMLQSHRVVYELLVAPIPEDMEIDHLCRVPACCNPDHLEAVTRGENLRRANEHRRANLATHCGKGHEFTAENTYVWHGKRRCRTCHRDLDRISNNRVIK